MGVSLFDAVGAGEHQETETFNSIEKHHDALDDFEGLSIFSDLAWPQRHQAKLCQRLPKHKSPKTRTFLGRHETPQEWGAFSFLLVRNVAPSPESQNITFSSRANKTPSCFSNDFAWCLASSPHPMSVLNTMCLSHGFFSKKGGLKPGRSKRKISEFAR